MKREYIGWIMTLIAVGALVTWVARNTYWVSVQIPQPPKGEAATNPFYIREKFAQALGARTRWARDLSLPPGNGVAYLSMFNWDLIAERRRRLEQWVEHGGRLVVDGSLITGTDSFATWSGIRHETRTTPRQTQTSPSPRPRPGPTKKSSVEPERECSQLAEAGTQESYTACALYSSQALTTQRKADWSVRDPDASLKGVRIRIGRGSVTVLTGVPFDGVSLFAADNARLFVAATQLRRDDVIHFFSEADQDSLLELAWHLGWPVNCLIAGALALAIWRGSVRFGPLAAPAESARRSLAEQIRGTGQFALRVGSAGVLHAATARALNEAAARHINAYEALPGAERMQALAQVTGFEASSLAAALHYSGPGRTEHLRSDLELLEAARRRILLKHMRPRHGN